jgi:triosephosphate isomerase
MIDRKYIIANWKMYPITVNEVRDFLSFFTDVKCPQGLDAIICPPFPYLSLFDQSNCFKLGGQNCSDKDKGAFTGEVSAFMLSQLRAQFVLLGHSERRMHYHEANDTIKRKVVLAQSCGLTPVLCVGEPIEVYQEKKSFAYIQQQLSETLSSEIDLTKIIVAYEPIWAIGSGLTPTKEEIKAFAKAFKDEYDLPILYGGSVNAEVASMLAAIENLNGLLIGWASTQPDEFKKIIFNFSGNN